jgi:hypothetical protein
VGFESSRIARRRLAALAATNDRVHEALTPTNYPGLFDGEPLMPRDDLEALHPDPSSSSTMTSLARQLDELAQDIVSTPGAGGALLAAYAAQARALTMVIEAARRAGSNPLPPSVLSAAQNALHTPASLTGLTAAWS